ncbi:MAG: hypothetical protein V1921_03360 [Candidatus Altiarchaeota archaeon]
MADMGNEIYQELYAIRSRIDYLQEIWQEVYAVRSKMESIEGLLDKIYREIAAMRREMKSDSEYVGEDEKPPEVRKSRFDFRGDNR